MRKYQLLSVFSLFLLVPASITRAQTATLTGTVYIEQDYRVVNFSSQHGNVKAYFPGDLSNPGQGTVQFTGTVMVEPAGNTDKERAENLNKLLKGKLSVDGKIIDILAGNTRFEFSVSRSGEPSTGPPNTVELVTSVKMQDGTGKTAEVLLKNPVVSLPPMTGSLPAGQPSLFTDQKVFLTNGNIPVYAANNTATLFQPTDKFFIKDANGIMTEAIRLTQSPTQTVLSSEGIQPGAATIVRQSGNRTDEVNIRMAGLGLSCTDNSLRKGQTSSVTFYIDPKITDKDSAEAMQIPIMSLDVKNFTPGVIDMAGGNMQVMTFPTKPNSTNPADWQTSRTITGITPGNFNISATLYPSVELAGPFEAQKKALNSAEDFNRWAEGIKKDLEEYIKKLSSNQIEQKDIARHAIDNMPTCSSDGDMELCKWTADYLLRFLPGFKNAAADGAAAFAVYQTIADNLLDQTTTAQHFVHTDVIQNGLRYIQNASGSEHDLALQQNISRAASASNDVQNDYSQQNLHQLANALQQLNTTAFVTGLIKQIQAKMPDSKMVPDDNRATSPHPVNDLAGFLDPFSKILYCLPSSEKQILSRLQAKPQSDGQYQIQSMSADRLPVSYIVSVITDISPEIMFDISNEVGQAIGCALNGKDSVKKIDREKDVFIDPENEFTGKDGTVYRFYINAECKLYSEASKSVRCKKGGSWRKFPLAKDPKKQLVFEPNGNYYKYEHKEIWRCVKGNDFCTEGFFVVSIREVYQDPDCKRLKDIIKFYDFSCQ